MAKKAKSKTGKSQTEAGKIIERIVVKYDITRYRLAQLLGVQSQNIYSMEHVSQYNSHRLILLLLYIERYGLKILEDLEAKEQ